MARKVLVTDYAWPDLEIEKGILGEIGYEVVASPNGEEGTLAGLARDVEGIMTCWARTTRKVIESAPRLRVISRYGIGLDNIDVAFATQRGIPVTRVPAYCLEDVAEHTLSLLLTLSRKTALFDRRIRAGTWGIQEGLPLSRLTGRVLGLIGFGKIARCVVPRARAFGLGVIACSPSLTPEQAAPAGVRAVDLETLLATSDFVSVHCPSTDQTRGLINADRLRRMKPTAFLINTSRGDIVYEEALCEALRSGQIAGAALDVRRREPPEAGDRLIALDNVIHTPHAAFYSTESLQELQTKTAWECRRVLTGQAPENLVNPEYRRQG